MAGKFIPLDEAAAMLGVSPSQLDDMRKSGKVHAMRDGASWKFKKEELERVAEDLGLSLSEDSDSGERTLDVSALGPAGASELVLGMGDDEGEAPTTVGKLEKEAAKSGPQPTPAGEDSGMPLQPQALEQMSMYTASEVALTGEDVGAEDDHDLVGLSGGGAGTSDVTAGTGLGLDTGGSGSLEFEGGSDLGMRSDLSLSAADQAALGDEDEMTLGDDAEVKLDSDSDSVLEGGSDVTRGAGDTGINLKPSDSGLNLEEVPLDLAGSSVSSLELPEDDDIIALEDLEAGPEEATQLRADEDFQLAPSASTEGDEEESGSQVIALEESMEAFAEQGGAALEGLEGVEPLLGTETGGEAIVDDAALAQEPMPITAPRDFYTPAPEMAYSIWNILSLLVIVAILSVTGMLMTDVVRNMWSWDGTYSASSPIMDAIIQLLGGMGS